MRNTIIVILIAFAFCLQSNAQRMSTQDFIVRKITFQATDQIVPVNGITVEINKAKFRSDNMGQFTANIPVSNDLGFYVDNINAPGYVVSIPEDLTKKVFLSPNKFVIVLADVNAIKAERNRIYNNNKTALAKQEERLKIEEKKNQDLLAKITKRDSEYSSVLSELNKTKRQLELFYKEKAQLMTKIDSLSDNLSILDYATLNKIDQVRITEEKDGKWIDEVVDEAINKLEKNLNTNYRKKLQEFNDTLNNISGDYYQKFIKGNNQSVAINYFAYHYQSYLLERIYNKEKENYKVFDRMLDKIMEDDISDIFRNHTDSCYNKWRVKNADNSIDESNQKPVKTLVSAEEDFLNYAMYPDKWDAIRDAKKPQWCTQSINNEVLSTLKKVYSPFYNQCKKTSKKYVEKFDSLTNDELYQFASQEKRSKIEIEIKNKIRLSFSKETIYPYQEFAEIILHTAVEESLEHLRDKYNNLIKQDIQQIENHPFPRIDTKILPISSEKHCANTITWDTNENIEYDRNKYNKLMQDYPEYTSFLNLIVMKFMQPIIDKYDCEDALFTWKTSMEDDVAKYCFQAIKKYENKLSSIPNVDGSDNKCMIIVQTIVEIEKEKMTINHNERLKDLKKKNEKEEQMMIDKLKNNKKRFDKEKDVLDFLATHIFVNNDLECSSWYNSNISKWYMKYGQTEEHYDITYTITDWNTNSAKIKIYIGNGGMPVIIDIKLGQDYASYSEICGGETRKFSVTNK